MEAVAEKEAEQEKQIELIPPERQEPEQTTVELDRLPPDSALVSDPPSREMVESVRNFGVLQPIIVVLTDAGDVQVAAGRRRIKAARLAGLDRIPCVVYPAGWTMIEVLALTENAMRSANRQVDLDAIEALVKAGASLADIRKATGLPRSTIEARLRLVNLHPELRRALRAGKLSESVAGEAVKLTEAQQAGLVRVLAAAGRVTAQDVAAARQVQREQAVAALPAALFDTAPALDWRAIVREHLERAAAAARDDALQSRIRALLDTLQ